MNHKFKYEFCTCSELEEKEIFIVRLKKIIETIEFHSCFNLCPKSLKQDSSKMRCWSLSANKDRNYLCIKSSKSLLVLYEECIIDT